MGKFLNEATERHSKIHIHSENILKSLKISYSSVKNTT